MADPKWQPALDCDKGGCCNVPVIGSDGHAKYVSASAHGGYEIRPADEVLWDGIHPKIVYRKDGGVIHAFRFATEDDEPPENHYGEWRRPMLVSYLGFPDGLRDKLFDHDFGKAPIAIKDGLFAGNLERAIPSHQETDCNPGPAPPVCHTVTVPEFEFDYGRDMGSPGDPNDPQDDPDEPTGRGRCRPSGVPDPFRRHARGCRVLLPSARSEPVGEHTSAGVAVSGRVISGSVGAVATEFDAEFRKASLRWPKTAVAFETQQDPCYARCLRVN
ncbi:NPP1 family protein [Streptomyces sp. MUM 178J]|uniref:NPP1 family protein n=1 Tax=Streptomyces sp. MUM 178J TaxID=2791991 RepID=UPI002E7B01E0|nr:NPP1 family protein [Streptomyces sp. MUM 178J]WRQ81676.1 NPP1 family protein [Streptomyces sp. MUM 178J]